MATVRTSASPVAAARVVRLAVVSAGRPAIARHVIAVDPGEDSGEEEKDAVHDTQREAGLEHCAGLVGIDFETVAAEGAENAKVDVVGRAGGDVGAVGAGDEAEVVDTCDECANEAWESKSHGQLELHLQSGASREDKGKVGQPYRDQSARRIWHWRCSCGRGTA